MKWKRVGGDGDGEYEFKRKKWVVQLTTGERNRSGRIGTENYERRKKERTRGERRKENYIKVLNCSTSLKLLKSLQQFSYLSLLFPFIHFLFFSLVLSRSPFFSPDHTLFSLFFLSHTYHTHVHTTCHLLFSLPLHLFGPPLPWPSGPNWMQLYNGVSIYPEEKIQNTPAGYTLDLFLFLTIFICIS